MLKERLKTIFFSLIKGHIQLMKSNVKYGNMGIRYGGAGLVDVYCMMGSTPSCNKHLPILDLNISYPLLHGNPLLKHYVLCFVIVGR